MLGRESETGECPELIVVYRCGRTDKQKDWYERHSLETIVRRQAVVVEVEADVQVIEWKYMFSRTD